MRKLFPLVCDACGESIDTADLGWVEWLVQAGTERNVGRGLRLVHHYSYSNSKRCYHKKTSGWMTMDHHLGKFLGLDGMARLLELRESSGVPPEEIDELLMRLQMPGYDRARTLAATAVANGALEQNHRLKFLSTGEIECILDWADEQNS